MLIPEPFLCRKSTIMEWENHGMGSVHCQCQNMCCQNRIIKTIISIKKMDKKGWRYAKNIVGQEGWQIHN